MICLRLDYGVGENYDVVIVVCGSAIVWWNVGNYFYAGVIKMWQKMFEDSRIFYSLL